LRHCRCPRCGRVFYICESCWRGQIYCTTECSEAARVRSVELARQRYATSARGHRMHRQRQNRYRRRQTAIRKINVTDQTSPEPVNPAMLAVARDPMAAMVVACETAAMECGYEGNSSGAGGTGTRCADTGVGVAGVAGGTSCVFEVVAVARGCGDGASGGSGAMAGESCPCCSRCQQKGWVLSFPALPGSFRAGADGAGRGVLRGAPALRRGRGLGLPATVAVGRGSP